MSVGHFEGKKHAIRQTQDGWVVSFVVHPNDMSSEFATAPLGTRYMVGFAQIGSDELPVSPAGSQSRQDLPDNERADVLRSTGGISTPQTKPAGEPKSPAERAVIRAAILCSEPRFRVWMAGEDIGASQTAAMLREACGVESRADIAKDAGALNKFLALETEYLIEIGAMARPR
jgi:hypothetical protein